MKRLLASIVGCLCFFPSYLFGLVGEIGDVNWPDGPYIYIDPPEGYTKKVKINIGASNMFIEKIFRVDEMAKQFIHELLEKHEGDEEKMKAVQEMLSEYAKWFREHGREKYHWMQVSPGHTDARWDLLEADWDTLTEEGKEKRLTMQKNLLRDIGYVACWERTMGYLTTGSMNKERPDGDNPTRRIFCEDWRDPEMRDPDEQKGELAATPYFRRLGNYKVYNNYLGKGQMSSKTPVDSEWDWYKDGSLPDPSRAAEAKEELSKPPKSTSADFHGTLPKGLDRIGAVHDIPMHIEANLRDSDSPYSGTTQGREESGATGCLVYQQHSNRALPLEEAAALRGKTAATKENTTEEEWEKHVKPRITTPDEIYKDADNMYANALKVYYGLLEAARLHMIEKELEDHISATEPTNFTVAPSTNEDNKVIPGV